MSWFKHNAGVPDKYKQYVTNQQQLRAFNKAIRTGDMSEWEASVGYQPPPTPEPAGANADPEAVPPGGAVGGSEPTNLLEAAGTNSNQSLDNTSTAEETDVVSEITGGEGGVVKDIKTVNKAATNEKNTPFDVKENPTPESLPAGPEPEGGNEVLKTVEVLKEKGQATGPRVSQLQEYAETMTGIKGRTPGVINAAGSATIAALSGLGKNIDEVQSGFSKFRENIKGRVASGVSALKGEVGWGSHSSEYDQFKSDLKASGLDEDTVRRGRAHSEGQDAEDAGGVEVGQEDKKKLESDEAHQKYKSDMIAAGGAIGANAFKGGGGKAVSFNRMGQY